MEACLGVEREANKVFDKFVSLQSSNDKALSETQALLRSAKNEIQYEGECNQLLLLLYLLTNLNHYKFNLISKILWVFKIL